MGKHYFGFIIPGTDFTEELNVQYIVRQILNNSTHKLQDEKGGYLVGGWDNLAGPQALSIFFLVTNPCDSQDRELSAVC